MRDELRRLLRSPPPNEAPEPVEDAPAENPPQRNHEIGADSRATPPITPTPPAAQMPDFDEPPPAIPPFPLIYPAQPSSSGVELHPFPYGQFPPPPGVPQDAVPVIISVDAPLGTLPQAYPQPIATNTGFLYGPFTVPMEGDMLYPVPQTARESGEGDQQEREPRDPTITEVDKEDSPDAESEDEDEQ